MKVYRSLLFFCACYFFAVSLAHQLGAKLPLLFVFYAVPSERYQDLIISFLAFGWSMLFFTGFSDGALKARIQVPVLLSGTAALVGLVRARLEVPGHREIDFEIVALALLLLALAISYAYAKQAHPADGNRAGTIGGPGGGEQHEKDS